MTSHGDNDIVGKKKKRIVLSIETKLKISRKQSLGQTIPSLATEYNLGKSTISDIIQSEDRLKVFAPEIEHASGNKRCIIRKSAYYELDKALHLWFLQK